MRRTIIGATLAAASVAAGGLLVAELAIPGSAASGPTAVATYDAPGANTTTPSPANDPIQSALKDLVTKGVITQAQADAVDQALRNAMPKRGEFGGGFRGGPFGGPGRGPGFGMNVDTIAKALGIDTATLRTELQNGSTIADIAKAHSGDVQKVIDALVADAKTKLDKAVTDGHLTQAQEDQMLKDATTRFTNLVNNKMPSFGPHGGMFGPRPGQASPPSTSNA